LIIQFVSLIFLTIKIQIIKNINKLKKNGHIIKMFTSRYMNKCNGNVKLINKKYKDVTSKQLRSWGLDFDELIMGKPVYDFIVDDKILSIKDLKKFNKIQF